MLDFPCLKKRGHKRNEKTSDNGGKPANQSTEIIAMNDPKLYLDAVLDFELRHHHPNPDIDDMLHGDRTRTDEDGNEIIDEGTPEPPVVIEPEPDPDPPNPNPGPAPNPNPGPSPNTQQGGDSRIEPLTKEKLDALTQPGGVTTGGVFRGGTDDEFLWDGKLVSSSPVNFHVPSLNVGAQTGLLAIYGINVGEDEHGNVVHSGGDEQLYGGEGNDVLVGGWGADILDGGPGNDYLFGGLLYVWDGRPATDREDGESNILMGGPGNDYLAGGGEINILNGGPGNDHLVANGEFSDVLIGGPGRDVFDVANSDIVKIMDFQDGEDKILLVSDRGNGYYDGTREYLALYQLAAKAGVQFDMGWIATEVDNGVTLPLEQNDNDELTIEGAYLANLQFELVNGDLFIV